MDTLDKARQWCKSGERGLSSETICEFFTGWPLASAKWAAGRHPTDPSDFGRCKALLDAVPEWRPRIGELAALSPVWAALVAQWDEIETLFIEEAPSGRAPRTYQLMREIITDAEPTR